MGSGKSNTPSLPPPPPPTIQYDPVTTAAENALASQAKASYASSIDDGKKKQSTLGDVSAAPAPAKKREVAPASMMPSSGSLGGSAVLTG